MKIEPYDHEPYQLPFWLPYVYGSEAKNETDADIDQELVQLTGTDVWCVKDERLMRKSHVPTLDDIS